VGSILHDIKYSLRALARSPGLTAAAVMTLALGVGANTTVFSWVRGVLLEPLPGVSEPGRLRVLSGRSPSDDTVAFSYPEYRDFAALGNVFEGVLAQRWANVALGARRHEPARQLSSALVSGNYFDVLGVRPALGRGFRREEDAGRGSPAAAVLSHGLWERSFHRDPGIVGAAVTLNGRPYTVVGVAPDGFFGSFLGVGVDLWIPLSQTGHIEPGGDRLENRGDRWLLAIGRLRAGVRDAQARETVSAEAARLSRDFPKFSRGYAVRLSTLGRSPWGVPEILRPILLALAALVSLVLLIACANLSSLLLSRAIGRRREIAVRLALGAGRWRLARQLLTEGLVLALLGGAAAVLLTFWTSGLLLTFVPATDRPVRLDLGVDASVLAFAFGAAALSSLLYGLLPALQASRPAVAADLASESGSVVVSRGRARLRAGLVVAQVAFSLVLLVSAGLFLRSLAASRALDPGFDGRRLLLIGIDLHPLGYAPPRGLDFFDRLLERARSIPGARDAALARRVPLGFGGTGSNSVEVEGYAPKPGEELMVAYNSVSAGYFRAMAIAVRRGREFDPSDREGAAPVVVVNETFARRYFAGREAVGGRVHWNGTWRQVVGVMADGKYRSLDEAPLPYLWVPLAQVYRPGVVLHVRTTDDPAGLTPAVREAIRQLDPNLPLLEVQTMEQHLQEALLAQRIGSSLLGVLGLIALAIAVVGLYAVASHAVAERRREIGVRMALGAAPRQILERFLGQSVRLVGLGVAIGLAAALAVTRLFASLLTGIEPTDPAAYAGVIVLVLSIAAAATYLPARRATRIDPIRALRQD
jgi:macrolide transport system ATP-binding/permease protein